MMTVAVVWLCLYNKATGNAKAERALEAAEEVQPETAVSQRLEGREKRLFLVTVCVLCFGAIGVNLIKDGLTTWVPSILKEEFGMPDALSILMTLFLPTLAVFANAVALKAHKRIPDYVNHLSLVFALVAVFIGVILFSMKLETAIVMLLSLLAAHFLASTLGSLVTSIFPMFMRGKVNSGMIAGVINGFCYLGSTISSYGLGSIADRFGWTAVFWTLLGVCGVICVVWCGYAVLKWHTKRGTV